MNRNNPLGASTLALFGAQIASRFYRASRLGRPSLSAMAEGLVLTPAEQALISTEARDDVDVWCIAPGADARTLIAAKAFGWLETWQRWDRAQAAA